MLRFWIVIAINERLGFSLSVKCFVSWFYEAGDLLLRCIPICIDARVETSADCIILLGLACKACRCIVSVCDEVFCFSEGREGLDCVVDLARLGL